MSVSLAPLAGREAQLRFRQVFNETHLWTADRNLLLQNNQVQEIPDGGVMIDNIAIDGAQVFLPLAETKIGTSTSFTYAPPAGSGGQWHRLVVVPEYFNGFPGNPGPGTLVYVQQDAGNAQRLVNLSSRSSVAGDDHAMTAGFVIDGAQPKQVLLRAVGPSLAAFGLSSSAAARTKLEVFGADGTRLGVNFGWDGGSDAATSALIDAFTQTGAFGLGRGNLDSALILTLPPGLYSGKVTGSGSTGVALVEVYEMTSAVQRFINLSTLADVASDAGVLIGGVVISGTNPQGVLVRAIGPGLKGFGVGNGIKQPHLEVFRGSQVLATNDGWDVDGAAATVSAAGAMTGAFSLAQGSGDAGTVVVLPPGAYTFKVSNRENANGVALLELYRLP